MNANTEHKEKQYLALEQEEELVDISEEPEEEPESDLLNKEGTYYWIAQLPMDKCFCLLFEVWKVLAISAGIVSLLGFLINIISGEGLESFFFTLGMSALVLGILFVLSIPAYYIVTKANDNKYTVLFEMDDDGIDHVQIMTDKAKALNALTSFTGSLAGKPALRALGLRNSNGASLYSSFKDVRKIRIYEDKGLIVLQGKLFNNQVYIDEENFGFVYAFIRERCPNAK